MDAIHAIEVYVIGYHHEYTSLIQKKICPKNILGFLPLYLRVVLKRYLDAWMFAVDVHYKNFYVQFSVHPMAIFHNTIYILIY